MKKRCHFCGGQFGLWRHNKHGHQFCAKWCVAHYENNLRDRMKALEARYREAEAHRRFGSYLFPTAFMYRPP